MSLSARALTVLLVIALVVVAVHCVLAQALYVYEVEVTERSGSTLTNYSVPIVLDLSDLVLNGTIGLNLSRYVYFIDDRGTPLYYWLESPATVEEVMFVDSPNHEVIVYGIFNGKLYLMKTYYAPSEIGYIDLRTGEYRALYRDVDYRFTAWRPVYVPQLNALVLAGQYYEDYQNTIIRSAIFIIYLNNDTVRVVRHPNTGDCNEFIGVDLWCPNETCWLVVGERIHGGCTNGSAYPAGGGVWLIPLDTLFNVNTWTRVWQHPRELEIRVVEAVGSKLYILAEGSRGWCPGCVEVWRWDETAHSFTLVLNLTGTAIDFDDFPAWMVEYNNKLYVAVSEKDYHVHILVIDPVTDMVVADYRTQVPASGRVKMLITNIAGRTVAFIGVRNVLYMYVFETGETYRLGYACGTIDFNRYCYHNGTLYFGAEWCIAQTWDAHKLYSMVLKATVGKAKFWVKVPEIPARGSVRIYAVVTSSNPYLSYHDPSRVFLYFEDFLTNSTLSAWSNYTFGFYGTEEGLNPAADVYVKAGVLLLRKNISSTDYGAYMSTRLPDCAGRCLVVVAVRFVGGYDHTLRLVLGNATHGFRVSIVLNHYVRKLEYNDYTYSGFDAPKLFDDKLWVLLKFVYGRETTLGLGYEVPHSRFHDLTYFVDKTPDVVWLGLAQGRGAATGVYVEKADVDYIIVRKFVDREPDVKVTWRRPNTIKLLARGVAVNYVLVNDSLTIELPTPGNVTVILPNGTVRSWAWVTTLNITPTLAGVYNITAHTLTGNFTVAVRAVLGNLTVRAVDLGGLELTYMPVKITVRSEATTYTVSNCCARFRLPAGTYTITVYVNDIPVAVTDISLDTLSADRSVDLRCNVLKVVDYRNATRVIYWTYGFTGEVETFNTLPYAVTRVKVTGRGEFKLEVWFEKPPTAIFIRSNVSLMYSLVNKTLYITATLSSTGDMFLYDMYRIVYEAVDTLGHRLAVPMFANGTEVNSGESKLLHAGTYIVHVPEIVDGYRLAKWSDNVTASVRTVQLTEDKVLKVIYKVPTEITDLKVEEVERSEKTVKVRVSGMLVDRYGQPVAGRSIIVHISGEGLDVEYLAETDRYGRFAVGPIELLANRQYNITVEFTGDDTYVESSTSMVYTAGQTVTIPIPTGVSLEVFTLTVASILAIALAAIFIRARARRVLSRSTGTYT